jgi:hypothetical protein
VVLLALAVLQMRHAGGAAVICKGYTCVTQVVLLALVVLQLCQAGGGAGSGSVTNVSHRW